MNIEYQISNIERRNRNVGSNVMDRKQIFRHSTFDIRHCSRQQLLPGNILPLALVITATILLAGFSLGIIVLESLKRTAETDASTVAYYAADAGIEKQLYEVRKKYADISDLSAMGESYANGSAWQAASSGFIQTQSKVFPVLNEGDFQFVDLFYPDNVGASGGIGRVQWSWVGPGAPCEVELGYSEWDFGSGEVIPENFAIERGIANPSSKNLNPLSAYRLRFRPRKCDITNLEVKVFTNPGDVVPVPFPGDITLGSEGTYDNTTQAISVTMPRQDVLSGVFSYVIFTECTLFKDPSGVAPICP